MSVNTVTDHGFDGTIIDIECHITNGLPAMIIVGFASKTIEESKERIRSAFSSLPVPFPKKRITINLAPADIPKTHTSFDLAIAAAILESSQIVPKIPPTISFFGELGLNGILRPVRGLIGKLMTARKAGIKTVVIPWANAPQAQLVEGLDIITCENLLQAYQYLAKPQAKKTTAPPMPSAPVSTVPDLDFKEIVGQEQAKRALTIAAAGRHNILLNGPPGTGKSMLAQALISVLPPMTRDEILETTHLHSLSSLNYDHLVTIRPFRAPHHSASDAAIIGGGAPLRPGEISLAHHGVLFFDEFPEFKRHAIEALRQPLENRAITITRTHESVTFPAHFILVATANPCPCGYYGTSKPCSCMPAQLHTYRRKLSGPIIDRIDVYVDVDHIDHRQLLHQKANATSSQAMRVQVQRAISRQRQRFKQDKYNGEMTNKEVKRHTNLRPEAQQLLETGAKKLALSPRAYLRTLKVARTIADIDDSDTTETVHIAEALRYRPLSIIPP